MATEEKTDAVRVEDTDTSADRASPHHREVHVKTIQEEAAEQASPLDLGWRTWLVVFLSSFTIMAQVYTTVAAASVVAFIAMDFEGSSLSGWIIQGPLLMQAALSPIVGRLSDILDRKYLASIPPLIAFVGAVVCAKATSMNMLIGGSILVGVTLSTIAIVQSIPSEILPLKYRAVANGIAFLGGASAGIIGQLSAGAYSHLNSGGWRYIFWTQAAFHLTSAIGFLAFYWPPRHSDFPRMKVKEYIWACDPIGSFLFIGSSALILLALDWAAGTYPWSDAHVIAPLVIGCILLIVFGVYEWKARPDGLVAHVFFRSGPNFPLSVFAFAVEGWIFYSAVNAITPQMILRLGWEADPWRIAVRQLSYLLPIFFFSIPITWIPANQSIQNAGGNRFPLRERSWTMLHELHIAFRNGDIAAAVAKEATSASASIKGRSHPTIASSEGNFFRSAFIKLTLPRIQLYSHNTSSLFHYIMSSARRKPYLNTSANSWIAPPGAPSDLVDAFHRKLPGYAPTRLVPLPSIASELGVAAVYIKEESNRIGVPSFKILGASWGTFRAVTQRLHLPLDCELSAIADAAKSNPITLVAATAGNHGRAVARVGSILGLAVEIFVPQNMHPATQRLIASEGAKLAVVPGDYDTAVRAAWDASQTRPDAILIQDTAFDGYEDIPNWIVQGYTTLLRETTAQLPPAHARPTHVLAPVGVGSFAQAVISYYRSPSSPSSPSVTTVEPDTAACLHASLRAGNPVSVQTAHTIMAGLNCGTVSTSAWPLLRAGVSAAVKGYEGNALSGEVRDGKLYGRGAADMKGGVAAAMATLVRVKDAGLRGDVIFAGVADEEDLSIGTEQLLKAGWTADAAVVSEPTGENIIFAHKGFVWVEVDVLGVASHGSRPDLGLDAISKAGYFLVELDKHAKRLQEGPKHPELGPGSIHASIIQGGEEASSYPAKCTITVEKRTLPGETADTVREEVENILKGIAAEVPDFRYDLRATFSRSTFEIEPDHPFVSMTAQHTEKATGTKSDLVTGPFWTDCALISEKGIPAVVYGPKGEGLHAKTEWVDLGSVEAVAETLTSLALDFCK
ncbi:Pyridoxal phosphate-dependent enzyme beta subunit [Macrophomina phaseolina MS6]|uniref:Pyridoxal phosphate-dependent enzyme beta subunit n=1 Tax=Macrophomina phaseolina (strain MS6) TaxID=1126212 RepID=K2S3F3_MACPH|nr:Pyridoxal phosphate-dependent enzyme beta subunit [Macrophomina phaseolina MS6]